MKKYLLVLGMIVVIFVFSALKVVNFSETKVLIQDTNGKSIENANVQITYLCTSSNGDVGGGHEQIIFGYREGLTNNQGSIKFNPLKSGFHFLYGSCSKHIRAFKAGYCGAKYHPSVCLGVDYTSGDFQSYIERSELIPGGQKEDTILFKKLEDYSAIVQSVSQRKTYIVTSNMCEQISNKIEREICYKQLAIQEKDISLCLDIGDDFKYDYCKSDVIKKIGDISKCALINDKNIRSLCEVYCS